MTNILLLFLLHGIVYSDHCKDAGGKEMRCTKTEDKEIKSSLLVMSTFHRTPTEPTTGKAPDAVDPK